MDDLSTQSKDQRPLALVPYAPEGRALYVASPYPSASPAAADAEVGLFQYWAIIRRNSRTVLLASFAGLVIGLCVGIPMKRIYRATTTIEILSMNESFLHMKDTNPVNEPGDYDVSEEETQAGLLTTSTLMKRVAAKLDPEPAIGREETSQSPVEFLKVKLGLDSAPGVSSRTALVAKAIATLKVRNRPHTRLVEATADSSDPRFAAEFLNTLSSEFVRQNQESRLFTTANTGDWLTHELSDARDKLRKSEDALQAYARGSGIVYSNESTNVATERLQQYQQSLSAATADRIAKQSRYELAQSASPLSLADVLNDASLRDTQSKINDLKRQIADLSTVYSAKYEKIRRLESEMQSAESAFDAQRTEILDRIKTDYDEAARKEGLLARAYDTQTREVTGQGEKSIQYNILKREVDSNRQLYDTMLQQMKQASIASAMRASNVRIVDPADPPGSYISPDFKLNSAIGMLGGLLFSTFVVLIRDQMDRTLRSPGEVKLWTELPELGVIPNASFSERAYYQLDRYKSSRGDSAALKLGLPDGSPGNHLELASWQKRPTLLAESFRSALTSLLFIGETGTRPRVLVFTSASPAEGKTTAVSNLAIAAAEIRLKVLVIDADLRRPRLHQLFNLSNNFGLTNFLQCELTEEPPPGLIQESSVPNLHVLTAGPETHSAAHLLYSPNFAALIKRFREEYDMVLIDTPPMLQMTDARIASRQADAVVLIARAGVSSRDSIVAARDRFKEDHIRILGTVLNDWSPKSGNRYYYQKQ
jgi:capsular exopolysaccharide synthesis family protein